MRSALLQWTLGYLAGVLLGNALGCRSSVGKSLAILSIVGLLVAVRRRWIWPLGLPIVAGALGLWAQALPFYSPLPSSQDSPSQPLIDATSSRGLDDRWLLEGVVCGDVRSTASGIQLSLVPQALHPLGWPSPATESMPGQLLRRMGHAPWQVRVLGSPHESIWPGDRLRLAVPLHALQQGLADQAATRRAGPVEPHLHTIHLVRDAVLRLVDQVDQDVSALGGALESVPTRTGMHSAALCPQPIWLLRRMAQARQALLFSQAVAWAQLPPWLRGLDAPAEAAFVQAITLGERSALRRVDIERSAQGKPAIEAQIKEAGVYHILSVSGLHMSSVGLVFFGLASWFLRCLQGLLAQTRWAATWIAQRWAALATLPVLLAYTLISGSEPPTVRAAIALGLYLLGQLFSRRARLREGLALAVLWAGLPLGPEGTPHKLFSPSLILSFAATLGIAYLRPLTTWLRRENEPRCVPRALLCCDAPSRISRFLFTIGRLVARLLDASLAALLTTLPLLAYYFAEIQGASLLGNFTLTPVAELVTLPCGLLAALSAVIWPPLSLPFAALAAISARFSLWLAHTLAGLGLSLRTAAPCLLLVALWFVGLICLHRRPAWGRLLLAASLLAHLLVAWWAPRSLRLTFLDVGQGDAAVAELPGGAVVVIDTGRPGLRHSAALLPTGHEPLVPWGSADSAQAILGPFLRRRGHHRIDLLIISHRHPDHMGGALTLLQQFDVDILWLPQPARLPRLDREADSLATAEEAVRRIARQRGTLVAVPHPQTLSGVQIDVLSPCPNPAHCRAQARSDWHENDNSLVVALRYAGRRVLMTGDIEEAAEEALCQLQPTAALRADVLKLPHHGSRTSSSEALLQAVSPALAIASLGRFNRFGFPHPETLQRLSAQRLPVLRTDFSGSIRVEIQPSGDLHVQSQADAPPWSAWLPWRAVH
ncbi:MAG: DNA internalization-related competence protein ComEC/Rec2 [Myxococcales bacterium]|nr:DNA internalization-related competence protein ComEC/Rec2 [Myxococcales bacterium]